MNDNKFSYTYSVESLEEVENIRRKYISQEETPLERLRKLDGSVANKANTISLTLGVICTLILGVGMCFCLVWTDYLILGIIIGIVGIIGVCLAYPLHKRIIVLERKRIAPQIIKLTNEIQKK